MLTDINLQRISLKPWRNFAVIFFRNQKIGRKLFWSFFSLLVITIVVATFSIITLQTIRDEQTYTLTYPFERYSILKDLGTYFMDARRTMNRAAMYIHDPIDPIKGIDNQEENIRYLRISIDYLLERYRISIDTDFRLTEAEKQYRYEIINAFELEVHHYFDYYIENLLIAARVGNEAETIRLVRLGIYTVERALESYQIMDDLSRNYMHNINAVNSATAESAMFYVAALTLVGVVVGAIVTILFSKSLTNPIQKVVYALDSVANGNMSVDIDSTDITNDETGVLAQSVIKLIDSIKSVNDEVRGLIVAAADKGDLHHIIDIEKYSGEWQEIMIGLNRIAATVDAPIVEIRDVMNHLSDGKFDFKVTGDFKGDFLEIKEAVNNTIDKLSRYVATELERERELEKKQREEKAKERMQLMFEAAPLMIEIWGRDYRPLECNHRTLEYYRVADKKEYISALTEYFLEDHPNKTYWRRNVDKAFEEGFARFEFVDVKPGGGVSFLDVEAARMELHGDEVVVTYSSDMTQVKELQKEQQRIEVAEESSRAKSKFLARMSHEIRTPIAAVMGISEIELQKPNLPMRLEESFAKIYNSADLLLKIVNDILDLSKIEASKMELVQKIYDVSRMIINVVHTRSAYSANKAIKFTLEVDENLPTHLIADEVRIGQIINNIVSNAFKYTKAGDVKLSFKRGVNDEMGYITLIITVSDTGLGMTKEQLNNLSSEYTRYHEHEQHFVSGTGLGMPIVFNLVQMMDADIEIESEVNVGTEVTICIPQKVASVEVIGKEASLKLENLENRATIEAKKHIVAPEYMPYGRVLVVDDVEANVYVAKGLLDFYGLMVETCDNGYDAIDKISKNNVYDVIFMDHMMPGINGVDTMHSIRGLGYALPIVALTANAMIGQEEEFIKQGFDGFISKPIQTKQLDDILKKYVRDKQPVAVIEAALEKKPIIMGSIDNFQKDGGLVKKLEQDFIRRNKNVLADIRSALDAGNAKEARLLVHTVKGSAGLIHEPILAQIAGDIEVAIVKGLDITKEQLSALEKEVDRVLNSIIQLDAKIFDGEKAKEIAVLFDRTEQLLSAQSVESLDLTHELRTIPETAVLCRQIEDYDFKEALVTLAVLRDILF